MAQLRPVLTAIICDSTLGSSPCATPSAMAFPEITVGLFPDVGGSWLLPRVPGNGGLFLALTGALLNPGDAIYAGLADVHVAEERRSAVFDALLQVAWSNDTAHNHERLTHLLQSHASGCAASAQGEAKKVSAHAPVASARVAGFRPRCRPLSTPAPALHRRRATPWPMPKW